LTKLPAPVVEWRDSAGQDVPLIVMLHGWGQTEADMINLIPALPTDLAYASVRGPYPQRRHYAWFAPGRSFENTARWFDQWLDRAALERPVVLVGFSAGAAFAGGLVLLRPTRYLGAAIICGTLPFDANVPTPSGGLDGLNIFVAHTRHDQMIPQELLDRAWTYLTGQSGARATAIRYDAQHGISPAILADLSQWLTEIATSR
jgi:phospholipase/carboxylesterase